MPVMVPAADEVNRTPRLTWDASESDSTAGVSELENRLTVEGGAVVPTVMLNVSLAARPPISVTEVLTLSVPTSVEVGVPLKVRVAGVNVSHPGSAAPLVEPAV